MMNQMEATICLLHDLPELDASIRTKEKQNSIYNTVQAFVQITCMKVKEHNYKATKHCFELADRLYHEGNTVVKQAIENVFVFSLDSVFNQARAEQMEVRGLVPGSLYTAYINQVLHKGC